MFLLEVPPRMHTVESAQKPNKLSLELVLVKRRSLSSFAEFFFRFCEEDIENVEQVTTEDVVMDSPCVRSSHVSTISFFTCLAKKCLLGIVGSCGSSGICLLGLLKKFIRAGEGLPTAAPELSVDLSLIPYGTE